MPSVSVNFIGRFGNQMFQYATARAYAEQHGCTLHTARWVGQDIFELSDAPYKQLPLAEFDTIPSGATNITIHGYFQYDKAVSMFSAQKLRQWFKLQKRWQNVVDKVEIAAHLRHGDYIQLEGIYCIIQKESYVKACQKHGLNDQLITWVSEDIKNKAVSGSWGGISFLPDFLTLLQAKVLLRANSSFSWWAAALSEGAIYSPVVEARTGWNDVEFVPGNWPRIADSSKCNCKLSDLHVKP